MMKKNILKIVFLLFSPVIFSLDVDTVQRLKSFQEEVLALSKERPPSLLKYADFLEPGNEERILKNVSKEEILELIAKNNPAYALFAAAILSSVYESKSRTILNEQGSITPYGSSFCVNPEMLKYLIIAVQERDRIVLDIGAASGENAILLALAGARKVYVNDINGSELQRFRNLLSRLPEEIQQRLIAIQSSWKDLPDMLEAHSIDIICCRNVIHFYSMPDARDFLAIVGHLASRDALLLLSAQGKDDMEAKKLIENKEALKATQFRFDTISIHEKERTFFISGNYSPIKDEDFSRGRIMQLAQWDPQNGLSLNTLEAIALNTRQCKAIKDYVDVIKRDWPEEASRLVLAQAYLCHFYPKDLVELVSKEGSFVPFLSGKFDDLGHVTDGESGFSFCLAKKR